MDENTELLLRLVKSRYSSPDKIRLYEEYINRLIERGVPPILSFRHLADTLGVAPASLHCMAFKTRGFYKRFTIPKRNGGVREIISPHLSIDVIQRWIGNNIIQAAFTELPECVTGYVKGKSIRDHVLPHVGAESLIKLDLKDFFPSINVEDVADMFFEIGYVRSVARTLAALVTVDGCLPQGASTSPSISNIYMRPFDALLSQYCDVHGFKYTRYADDIVISGTSTLPECLGEIKGLFRLKGLSINHAKTRVYKRLTDVRFVTGLLVNQDSIRLPKAMRRRIRVQAHLFLKRLDELISGGVPSKLNAFPVSWRDRDLVLDPVFPERILGKLNYWIHIEPDNCYANSMKGLIEERLLAII